MSKLVTIGVPVYKRLEYLPNVLRILAEQDYPYIDLLISDNGLNGDIIPEIVAKHYPKPFRCRQNPATVDLTTHFNQLIQNATGEYLVILADDDEISSNYVSDLVSVLERHPEASIAVSVQETIDEAGNTLARSKDSVPETLSGPDFIRAAWGTSEYQFRSFSTFLARRQSLVDCGGFPVFWVACADEDALFVKLCLDNAIAFSTRCVFRKRFSESSDGYSAPIHDLARGLRDFLKFLDTEPQLLAYGASHPVQWRESKGYLVRMAWKHYHILWADIYRRRLTRSQWVRAVFNLPFIPEYYKAATRTLFQVLISALLAQGKKRLPWAYEKCRVARAKRP